MKKFNLLAASALTLFVATPAFAQDTPAQDDTQSQGYQSANDIVVTATRRNETVQDVPLAVTAVPNSLLENAGVQVRHRRADHRRKRHARDRADLQHTLFRLVEPVDLRPDHLAQALRDLEGDLDDGPPQSPRAARALDKTTGHQVFQHGNHEKRVPFGVAVQQAHQFLVHSGRRFPLRQELFDLGFRERLEYDLLAEMPRDEITLERVERLG